MASWRLNLRYISPRALATAQGRWILIGASESLAKQGSPASGHRLTFFLEMFFFGGPSWTFFSGLQLRAFWASGGSLGASQNPSALCIKSGWAGASVALKIRSEYLKKEALLLLGGPGGPRGALRKPKKFRLGSLAASIGRRTDPLHIYSGSWAPGPQTLSFCRVSGRVRITRKYAIVSAWALIGPWTDFVWEMFFGAGRLGTFFWGVD